jgi:hypothetical protein
MLHSVTTRLTLLTVKRDVTSLADSTITCLEVLRSSRVVTSNYLYVLHYLYSTDRVVLDGTTVLDNFEQAEK